MANNILTPDMITREALRVLENNLVLVRNVNRQYDSSFAQEGAKIGSTLRIRKPDRSLVSDGAALQVQDENQQYTTLTVSSQKHIGLAFTSAELTMNIDEFSKLIIQPRVSQLAATIDADVAQGVAKLIGQSVGTPGTTPATSQVLLQGQQKLNEMAAPMGSRYATVNPAANAALVEGMKGFFNPSSTISKQFKTGMMGEDVLGYDEINMSQSIGNFTTGTRTSGTLGAGAGQGATSLTLAGVGNNATIKAGDVFTINNVFAVNPQTRQSTGSLFQFVVKADVTADGSGNAVVSVDAIYDATNALATVNVLPSNGAAVTFLGAASTGYVQNLIYHQDAITFATADLVMPKGTDMASRVNHNGISLRMIRDYDVNTDRLVTRLDVLYGYGVLRPELACRLWG